MRFQGACLLVLAAAASAQLSFSSPSRNPNLETFPTVAISGGAITVTIIQSGGSLAPGPVVNVTSRPTSPLSSAANATTSVNMTTSATSTSMPLLSTTAPPTMTSMTSPASASSTSRPANGGSGVLGSAATSAAAGLAAAIAITIIAL